MAHANGLAGIEEFIHTFEHIKVHNPSSSEALLLGQPGQRRRRVTQRIEGEEGVQVHVDHIALWPELYPSSLGEDSQLPERLDPNTWVVAV